MAPTMLEELCKRIQHCCATLRRSRNKRNVGSCWLKSLTGFKTLRNNTPETTCNRVFKRTRQRWELLANNVAYVCTQPYRPIFRSGQLKCIVLNLVKKDIKPKKHLPSPTLLGQQCWELLRSFVRSLTRSPEGFHTNKTDNQTVFLFRKDIRGRA